MAFEPIFEVTKLDSLKRLCSSQAVVEAKLLPSSGASIAKVLSIATDCAVTPADVFAGEARYNGRVCFKVIFVDSEGSNHCMDYNADFTDKLVSNEIVTGLTPMLSSKILDTDIVNVDEREIKLACVVEVSLDAVLSEDVNILTNGGENVYTHDDAIEYNKLVREVNANVSLSETLSNVRCANVLLVEPKTIIVSKRAGLDSIVIDGKVISDIVIEDDGGEIMSYQTVTPFLEEISASGADENSFVAANCAISSYKAVVESNEDTSAVLLSYDIAITAKVFAPQTISAIVDAFSVTNELLQAGQSVKVVKNRLSSTMSDRVDGSVTLDINMPAADNILAVTGSKINIANVTAGNGRFIFEGIVSCSILYYSQDTHAKNSVAVELPFSLTQNADVDETDEITAKGIVSAVNAKIRRGNEIDIKAEVEIEVFASAVETKYVITELSLGEQRELPTSAFQIHIAKKGETLWDVAKALGTTPELVLSQNPSINLPLNGGERVIVYRHLR